MDHADDEVYEQLEEAAVDDVVTDVEGFSGEPHDTSVLMDYVYHVATEVWNGEVFIFLNKNIFVTICYYCLNELNYDF